MISIALQTKQDLPEFELTDGLLLEYYVCCDTGFNVAWLPAARCTACWLLQACGSALLVARRLASP